MSVQLELLFNRAGSDDGLSCWLQQRELETRALARRLNLPVGHNVEVFLRNGMRLSGKLQAVSTHADAQGIELRIGKVSFSIAEMASCVRED